MKKTILILLVLPLLTTCLSAQETRDRSFGAFPMIPQSFTARAAARENEKMKGTPAYKKAQQVYQRLVDTRGDFRYPVPTFSMTRDKSQPAYIDYTGPEIFLEEPAYMVCESFGDQSEAAIAFLLGHELTHYYEKHAWRGDFADDNKDLTISKQLQTLQKDLLKAVTGDSLKAKLLKLDTLSDQFKKVERESQADYLGGFLAYAAGYGTFDRNDTLIGRLYRAYGYKDVMEGYITRSEREDLSRRSAERMKNLIEVFEMANLLTAIGRYEDAYQYYRYVLFEYQSREVYNNVGAAAMLHALKFFQENELKFRLPIQLDLEAAASKGPDDVAKRNKLLWQSIQHFDAAISLDPNYAPAYLNKACACTLLGDTVRAQYYANVEARKAATQGKFAKISNDIDILIGILHALSGNKTKAAEKLKAAAAIDVSGLAQRNLYILNDQTIPPAPERPSVSDDEKIDGKEVYLMLFPEEDKAPITVDEGLSFHQNTTVGKNSKLFFSRRANANTLFLLTKPNYPGTTAEGFKIGDPRTKIVKKYGEPLRSISTPNGEILAYSNILFILKTKADNPKEAFLERWALFKEP